MGTGVCVYVCVSVCMRVCVGRGGWHWSLPIHAVFVIKLMSPERNPQQVRSKFTQIHTTQGNSEDKFCLNIMHPFFLSSCV